MTSKISKMNAMTILIAVISVALLYVILLAILQWLAKLWPDTAQAGQFGDFAGGVLNPLIGWLALVAAGMAAFLTWQGLISSWTQNEQKMAMDMYQHWISVDMASDRVKGISYLRNMDLAKFSKASQLKIGHWAYPAPEEGEDKVFLETRSERYYQVLRVFEYLCAIELLARTRVIDIKLFVELAHGQITLWLDTFERISFKSAHDDGNPDHNSITVELNLLGHETQTRIERDIRSLRSRVQKVILVTAAQKDGHEVVLSTADELDS